MTFKVQDSSYTQQKTQSVMQECDIVISIFQIGLDICAGTEPLSVRCCRVGQTCLDNRNLPSALSCSGNTLSFFNADFDYDIQFKCSLSRGMKITVVACSLTLSLLTAIVTSFCQQDRARPACTSVQSDQAPYCWLTNLKLRNSAGLRLILFSINWHDYKSCLQMKTFRFHIVDCPWKNIGVNLAMNNHN